MASKNNFPFVGGAGAVRGLTNPTGAKTTSAPSWGDKTPVPGPKGQVPAEKSGPIVSPDTHNTNATPDSGCDHDRTGGEG